MKITLIFALDIHLCRLYAQWLTLDTVGTSEDRWPYSQSDLKGTRKYLKIAMSFEEETAATVAAKNGSIALAAEITKVTGELAGDQNNDNGLLVEAFLKVEPEARGRAHDLFGAYEKM